MVKAYLYDRSDDNKRPCRSPRALRPDSALRARCVQRVRGTRSPLASVGH
jgi:hypothetical protein